MGVLLCSLVLTPVVLKQTPKVDDRREYAMRGLIDLGGRDDVKFTGNIAERVKSIEGSTVIYNVDTRVSVDVLGVVRQGGVLNSNRVEKLDGTILTPMRVESTMLFGVARVDRLRALYYPSGSIEIGTGWWRTDEKSTSLKGGPFSSYFKLEGEEDVGKRQTWRVSLDAHEADIENPVRVKGMLWIDKGDGSLIQGQWTINGFSSSATTPPMNARYELTRVERAERTPLNLAFSRR